MVNIEFWIATATDAEGDLHWSDIIWGDGYTLPEAKAEASRLALGEALPVACEINAHGPYGTNPPPLLDARELGAVLAGLRTWQAMSDGAPDGIADIADGCGEFEPLDADEIDALCERINQ